MSFIKKISFVICVMSLFGLSSISSRAEGVHTHVSQSLEECKGVILDPAKQPVIGASVMIKGTKTGTVTDLDGKFSLGNIKKGATLIISSIGYETKTVVWKGGVLNITLKEDSKLLNEAVVVGLNTQSRRTITAAISTVKADAIQNRPVTDVTSVLQGNVPGLNFATAATEDNKAGGAPGSEIHFNIRGVGSINGGGPYVLVDGVEQSLQNVNPADIESVSILKDASAAAIYGSRAAYGVVLVTTKSGKNNSFKLTYNGSVGASSPINMPRMMSSLEYAYYRNGIQEATGQGPLFTPERIKKMEGFLANPYSKEYPGIDISQDGTNWLSGSQYASTDWFDYSFKKFSLRHDHSLNISGGTDKAKYYVGFGYNYQGGLLKGVEDNLNKFNVITKASYNANKYLSFYINNNITYMNIARPLPEMSIIFHNIARSEPVRVTKLPIASPFNIPTWNNNLPMSGIKYNEGRISDAITMGMTITPLEHWKIIAEVKGRFNFNNNDLKKGQPYFAQPNGVLNAIDFTPQGYSPKGVNYASFVANSYSRYNSQEYYFSPNIYTTYNLDINRHDLRFLLGMQAEYDYFADLQAWKTGLQTDNIYSFLNASGSGDFNGDRRHWSTMGFYAKFNYNYKDTYFFEISGRVDGSSRFAPGHRFGIFPSASGGVDFARMDFFKNWNLPISQLKLRASYGLLGNQSGVGLYQYIGIVNLQNNPANGWLLPGVNSNPTVGVVAKAPSLPSTTITWEKVSMADIGLDLSAFNDRLTLTIGAYQRNTNDMVGPAETIPDIAGIPEDQRPKLNNSNLRTRGWELSINWADSFKSGWRYSIGGNVSDYKTVITKYNNPDGLIRNNHTGLNRNRGYYEGMDIGEIWGYKADDLFQTNQEVDEYLSKVDASFFKSENDWQAGDLKYIDLNGDGKISPGNGTLKEHGDLTIIGNATPRFSFGLNMSVGYKGFEVSALFQGVGLRQFPIAGSTYMFGGGSNFFKSHLDYFTVNNKGAYLPRLTGTSSKDHNYTTNTSFNTTRYLLNAAYMRLKNLTVSYTFNPKLIKKIGLSGLKLYLSGENLLTITKLPHAFDPETINQVNTWAGGSNEMAPGLTTPMIVNGNGKVYPMSRNFVFGVNISF